MIFQFVHTINLFYYLLTMTYIYCLHNVKKGIFYNNWFVEIIFILKDNSILLKAFRSYVRPQLEYVHLKSWYRARTFNGYVILLWNSYDDVIKINWTTRCNIDTLKLLAIDSLELCILHDHSDLLLIYKVICPYMD